MAERCKVRRGQAQHRRHEKEKEKAWGLRKADAKLGKELTWAKMRRSGGLLSGWISAMFFSARTYTTGSGVGVGGLDEAEGAI